MKAAVFLSLVGAIAASPCPYGQMAESGALSSEEAANFFAARAEGEGAIESQMKTKRAEHARQEQFYKRQLATGQLPLGGGLLNGELQPFIGELAAIELPTVQPTGLALVPDAAHPYIAPGPNDIRGMCPWINTAANHGYIGRNGVTTFAEAANACQTTLGFSYDLCAFLSGLGLLAGGDIPSGKYSVGGASPLVPNSIGPALGISKHGFFEVDNSIARNDHYTGNQADFDLDRFNQLVDIANKYGGQFGNEAFAEERVMRYNEARASNPDFNAGIKWLAVTGAERVFIFRAFPNGTDEQNANYANVAPFYMNETFPEEWFRRATPYNLADTGADIATLLATSPSLTEPGLNEGLNNFVPLGIDLADVSPNDATCFLATMILDETPGSLTPEVEDNFSLAKAFVNGAMMPFFSSFSCNIAAYGQPGADAGTDATPGPNATCSRLVNGEYSC